MNKSKFAKKAREIHGDKYNYDRAGYMGNNTKVCIVCPQHGEFWLLPNDHLKGRGCPKCNGKER